MAYTLFLLLTLGGADDAKIFDVANGLKITGKLHTGKPREIYRVKLQEGGTYVIDMISPNPRSLDPFLYLKDASGKTLASDDDGGAGYLNARIVFLARSAGVYRS
jgi:hypothetical protein